MKIIYAGDSRLVGWEEQGYFCHGYPIPLANKESAYFLEPKLLEWLSKYE